MSMEFSFGQDSLATDGETMFDFSAGDRDGIGSLPKLQVAPLIDTVLFLIFFYLVVGQLVMHQKDAGVQLPAMASPLAAQETPAEVIINLRPDGAIVVAGQIVTLDQLAGLIQSELGKSGRAGQSLRVVLRADRRQQVKMVNDILQRCRDAGLKEVVFRAQREDGA